MPTPHRPIRPLPSRRALLLCSILAVPALFAGCVAPPPRPLGLADLAERPGERSLLAAIRAYDEADYPTVEREVDRALKAGLQSPRDRATAHKLRAFVFCTSDRVAACESEFRAARAEDPAFELNKAEAGHPLWGPVYLRSRQ